jgi:hypothetical protein
MHTRSKVVVVVTLCSLFMSGWLLAEGPAKPLAEVAISASRVDWQPAGEHERLVLTVAGPDGLYFQREFGAGEAPFLSAPESALADGVYAYELRAEGREVQWGHLWVKAGTFMDKAAAARPLKPAVSAAKPRNITADTTISDDLIVEGDTTLEKDLIVKGRACIGNECTAVGTAPLTIRDFFNYQIVFEGGGGSPAKHDWAMQANDIIDVNGDFTIRDLTNGKIPFRIAPNAPDNAFTIYTSSGNIGLGTLTPAVRLDVKANAAGIATERLQNSSATGYSGTEYLDNAGNVGLYFGLDNAASTTRLNSINSKPIVVLTNSAERMRVTSAGSVGIGTTTPSSKFHVNGGDIRVSGGSFIDDGTTLNVPDFVFEPDYRLMPLDELRDFISREKHLPNVPSAEDVKKEGLNLSQIQMRLLEKVEELTLYTLKQDEQFKALQSENAKLHARLQALEQATAAEQQ